ncbi:SCO family protein [Ramlibacter sp. Leaf400]|uniref:SCO family protein n=1 Tax=Ramlibacter sp. Leaf400 TaxID=1736365 RepID=UPI0009E866F4|nr:SCO family protein [Ramlibacter sp. Leaf400]
MTSSPDPRDEAGAAQKAVPPPGRRDWLTACAGGLAATGGVGLAFLLDAAPGAPSAMGRVPASSAATGRFPDLPLVTHEGRQVRFYSDLVRGRTVFVSMMYAQCNERCPPMTQKLREVQEALGDRVGRDVFMYSISLQPEYDRPADLKAYRSLHRVGPGWTFLTGEKADVERLRFALGFYDVDPRIDADIGQHIGMVRIGNDALDRWSMAPILTDTHLILETFLGVDPVSRARGRTWAVPAEG